MKFVSLSTVILAAMLFAGCSQIPGLNMVTIQHTKVVNASSVPLCKVEIVHLGTKSGEGRNALNAVDVPLHPGSEKAAEIPRLPEGAAGSSWEVRSYTCRGLSHDADVLLAKNTVEDPNKKLVLH